jgi:hypothetical protein
MYSDIAAYGLLASIFIFNGLRMFLDKPSRSTPNPVRLLDRLRKFKGGKSVSSDS